MKMLTPSIDDLLQTIDARFTLVTLVMKRSHQLNNGAPRLAESKALKPVSVALEEIASGKIKAKRTKDSFK